MNETTWDVIDDLCQKYYGGLTGLLAKAAGLSSSSLDKSRRHHFGKKRSPTIATILKVCDACGITFTDFAMMYDERFLDKNKNKIIKGYAGKRDVG